MSVALLLTLSSGFATTMHLLGETRDTLGRALDAEALSKARARDAIDSRNRALTSLRRARCLVLTNAATVAPKADPMRRMPLAREALRLEDLPEAVSKVHETLMTTLEWRAFRGHEDGVGSAVSSPSGDRLLTTSNDKTAGSRIRPVEGLPKEYNQHAGIGNRASRAPSLTVRLGGDGPA